MELYFSIWYFNSEMMLIHDILHLTAGLIFYTGLPEDIPKRPKPEVFLKISNADSEENSSKTAFIRRFLA
jgi:hypothetical protein